MRPPAKSWTRIQCRQFLPKENMIALMGSQDKVLAVLQSVCGIVERRHTLPCLANGMLRGNAISNGFPEQGGGGAEQAEAGDEGAGAADGAPDVAQDDDGDGDGDPDSDRRRPRSKNPTPQFPAALFPFAHTSHYVGFCRSRIYQLIAAGDFPKPIKVGKSSRWIKTELDAWITHQSQQRTEV